MDDDFATIVKVAKWGRAVYINIQQFVQFQLTVNIVALMINFVSACITGTSLHFIKTIIFLNINYLYSWNVRVRTTDSCPTTMGQPNNGHTRCTRSSHRTTKRRSNETATCQGNREFHHQDDVAKYHWSECLPNGHLICPQFCREADLESTWTEFNHGSQNLYLQHLRLLSGYITYN